jgi:hypothetical protein
MSETRALSWRQVAVTLAAVFLIAAAGGGVAFGFWRQSLEAPQVVVLGSGNRLSLLVTDGPARLVLATGDTPIAYENALSQVRPLFARRIDVLLLAGEGNSLLVPHDAAGDPHVRTVAALAPLPSSPEAIAIGPVSPLDTPRRIQLGPRVAVTVETALPAGADPDQTFPPWRAVIEHGETRIVALSDGEAASLFPPTDPASVLIVSSGDPAAAWDLTPAVAVIADGQEITGPALRAALAQTPRPPEWGFLVFNNEALRLSFIPGGVAIPGNASQVLSATPAPGPT